MPNFIKNQVCHQNQLCNYKSHISLESCEITIELWQNMSKKNDLIKEEKIVRNILI